MKTNLQNKYKDRLPEDTVNIIKDFFSKKGFEIEEAIIKNPMPNIWWCRVILKYNNIEIQGANGKGTTKCYALASGYAELYERYCNFQNVIFFSKINQDKFFELNYKEKGYNLFPDEIFLSPTDGLNSSPRIKNFCNSINDNRNSVLKYFQESYQEGLLSLPFKGLNMDSEIILPLVLLFELTGSSGSAAGNTINEALVQGCSELCEHYVESSIYYESRNFKKIDLEKNNYYNNDNIKLFFQKLKENNNYSYSLFDFSYLYNMPVLGLYIIDLEKKVAFLNLGASPIFEIALERCCTEIYQGHTILGDNLKNIMYSFRDLIPHTILTENFSSITFAPSYPDNFLINVETIDDFNQNIFLKSNSYTNEELKEYYITLFNKLNWEVYYRDVSQTELFKAIKIYINNIDGKSISLIKYNNNIPTLVKKRKWDILFKKNQLITEYFNTQKINEELLKQYIELKKCDDINYNFVTNGTLMNLELFSIPGVNKNIDIDLDILYNSLKEKTSYGVFLNSYPFSEKKYEELYKYSILFNYQNKYSIKEIKEIAQQFNIEYTEEDFLNRNNILYYLDKLYFSLYYNYYNSSEYKQLLKVFII